MAKGQMVFEFTIAALMFFGIMFFIISYLNQSVRNYSSDAYTEVLQGKAFQISDVLVKNPGIWVGDPGEPMVPGVEAEWPVLNSTKMAWLNVFCTKPDGTGYSELKSLFGLKEKLYDFDTGENRNFNITMTALRGPSEGPAELVNCGKDPAGSRRAYIKRVGVTELPGSACSGNICLTIVDVSVW